MQEIRHENVVKYVDAWTDSDVNPKFFSIVMEYCDGGDLQVISKAGYTLFLKFRKSSVNRRQKGHQT